MSNKTLTFIGGGYRNSSGGDNGGINSSAYVNTEYWSYVTDTDDSNKKLVCQKAFNARVICVQGCDDPKSVQVRRSMYLKLANDTTEDFLDTTIGQKLVATVVRRFNAGDVVKAWQDIVYSPTSTVGLFIIMAV